MKLTPGVNFTNILRAPFMPIFWCQKSWNVIREKLQNLLLYDAQFAFVRKTRVPNVGVNFTSIAHDFFAQSRLEAFLKKK